MHLNFIKFRSRVIPLWGLPNLTVIAARRPSGNYALFLET
jgi:hypothetical protein